MKTTSQTFLKYTNTHTQYCIGALKFGEQLRYGQTCSEYFQRDDVVANSKTLSDNKPQNIISIQFNSMTFLQNVIFYYPG